LTLNFAAKCAKFERERRNFTVKLSVKKLESRGYSVLKVA